MYAKYASEAGFGIRKSTQKRLRDGFVKEKYLVCNKEWCPKKIHLNTLAPKKGDKKVRTSNFRISGCKARAVFHMIPGTTQYKLGC